MDQDAGPGLAVAAVARRLGVAPATLRTWDRRYGLGPSRHTPGRHRRYGPDDLARLEVMRGELLRGVAPADAARVALAAGGPVDGPGPAGAGAAVADEGGEPARTRHGTRPGLRPAPAGGPARGLDRAARAMDAAAARQVLVDAVTAGGLVATWDDVVLPVLRAVADRWASTGRGVEVEHLVSDAVSAVYQARSLLGPPAAATRPVLLAGMPGERHVLGLTALAAVLAERGIPSRPLGADLPADALVAALRRTAPAAVVLWAQVPGTADAGVLAGLPRTRPGFATFTAGAGWDGMALPARVRGLDALGPAADELADLLGGRRPARR